MQPCPWCSSAVQKIYHWPCPNVEEVEYYENGNVKRIKFRDPNRQSYIYKQVINPPYNPYPYTVTWTSNGNSGQSTIHP